MNAGPMTTNGWPEQSAPFMAADEPLRQCRVCGCTDEDCTGCIERQGAPCWWVASDLCSACQLAAV